MADEPDIIQELSVTFNVVNDVSIDFTAKPKPVKFQTSSDSNVDAKLNSNTFVNANLASTTTPIDAQFGTVYVVGGDCRVLYATTDTWNSQPTIISARGYVYIYSDYKKNDHGDDIPGMKVGDGVSYLIDMPFSDSLLYSHLEDNTRHITQEEREFWNNKVRCFLSEVKDDNLIFTTN